MEALAVLLLHALKRSLYYFLTPDLYYFLTPPNNYRRSTREWIDLFIDKGIPSRLAEEVVTYLKEGKGHFPSGRTCGALYGLFKNYSSNIVAKALSAALEDRVVNYKHVRMLCDHFDFVLRSNGVLELAASEQRKANPIIHQNIRNNYE